jgi:hypothetical protein
MESDYQSKHGSCPLALTLRRILDFLRAVEQLGTDRELRVVGGPEAHCPEIISRAEFSKT